MFNSCTHLIPHTTDMIHSTKHNYMYVDNVKAGSTYVRTMLWRSLNESWWMQRGVTSHSCIRSAHRGWRLRMTTGCFNHSGEFVFSIVRDPVSKFESGVREARVQDKTLEGLTADEILDMQIRQTTWLNEHLQPSSYRLGAFSSDGVRVVYDFVGALETLRSDWPVIVANFEGVTRSQKSTLLDHDYERQRASTQTNGSKLSVEGIRRMCSSDMYRHEWGCFGYARPAECT